MEPKGSLSHSQAPTTCPNRGPDQPSPCLPSHLFKVHFNQVFQVEYRPIFYKSENFLHFVK